MDRTWGRLYVALEKDKDDTTVVPLISQLSSKELMRTAPFGYTVLHLAAEKGRVSVVVELLEKVPDEALQRTTWDQCTALHLAAEHRQERVMLVLIDRMSESALMMRDTRRRTALHWAAEHSLLDAARALVHALPPEAILLTDELNDTPLHCCGKRESASVLLFLASYVRPMGLLARGEIGQTVLHTAAEAGDGTLLRYLLALLPREGLAIQDNYGCTALHYAATSTAAAVGALAEHMTQQELAIADTGGSTALHLAASEGRLPMVECLVTAMDSADLGKRDSRGCTALHVAAQSGQQLTVKWLSDHLPSSIVSARDGSSKTAAEYECDDANVAWGELSVENAQRNLSIATEDLCFRLRAIAASVGDDHARLREMTTTVEETTRTFQQMQYGQPCETPGRLAPDLPRPAQLRALQPGLLWQSPARSPMRSRITPRKSPTTPTPLVAPSPLRRSPRVSMSQGEVASTGSSREANSPLLASSPHSQPSRKLFETTPLECSIEISSLSSQGGERSPLECTPTQHAMSPGSPCQAVPNLDSDDEETESDNDSSDGMTEAHTLSLSRQMARITTDPWALSRAGRRRRVASALSQPQPKPGNKNGRRRPRSQQKDRRRSSSSRSSSRGASQTGTDNGPKVSLHKQIAQITQDPSLVGKRTRREVDRASAYLGAADFYHTATVPSRKRRRSTRLRDAGV